MEIPYILPNGEAVIHIIGFGWVYYDNKAAAEADGYTEFEEVDVLPE